MLLSKYGTIRHVSKLLGIVLFMISLSSFAWADANSTGCDQSKGQAKGCAVSMPEPSALPEFALCLAGLGFFAYRQNKRRQSN
jgi:hypothetical protein